jgi:Protein of unknown function (DUF3630)
MVTMASGNLSLIVTEQVSWESFPGRAQVFLDRVNGRVLKRIDTPVERVWIVMIRWRMFWLTFEEFPVALSLDSMNRFCNPVVRDLCRLLTDE